MMNGVHVSNPSRETLQGGGGSKERGSAAPPLCPPSHAYGVLKLHRARTAQIR